MKRFGLIGMLGLFGCPSPAPIGDGSGLGTAGETDPTAATGTAGGELGLQFEEIEVEGGLAMATELRFVPGTGAGAPELLVLGKQGELLHLRIEGTRAVRLGAFRAPGVYGELDCGLISLAFDPAFATHRFLYVGMCLSQTESAIVRLTFTPEDYDAIEGSAVEILRAGEPMADRPWHNVGALGFDDTGALWALFGDKRVRANSQDLENPLGSVVRIIPRAGPEGGHEPAPDISFIGQDGVDPDVWAYGFRSPWRGRLDGAGRLWVGDVGSGKVEEIDLVTMPGQNFGWGVQEGPCMLGCGVMRDPVAWWRHDEITDYMLDDPDIINTSRRVAWVGLEHRGRAPDPYRGQLAGKMLFGDFCLGYVRALELDAQGEVVSDTHLGHLPHASSWDEGPDGFVYATTFGSCETVKLDPEAPPPSKLWRAVPVGGG